ncbi:MAG: phospholipase D-like domain-containing protein [Steroidobacteraceae bacterium]
MRWAGAAIALLWLLVGIWQASFKPLPPGTRTAGAEVPADADSVRLLSDVTTADAYGHPVLQQQIFDEALRVIAEARRFVVLDVHLFNAVLPTAEPAGVSPLRPLAQELAAALLAARRSHPALCVLLVTDPVNDLHGALPASELQALERAGAAVVRADLDALRDSNPAWTALWRVAIRWWAGGGSGAGTLASPIDHGPERVRFATWARLFNGKSDHRKVLLADDGADGLVGIVGSANAHDASSAHTNLALELRGAALQPLLASELALARAAGWRDGDGSAARSGLLEAASGAAAARPVRGAMVGVRVLTEGAIRDALLEHLGQAARGDVVDVAVFQLADRSIVEALLGAAQRGAEVRLLLDPNRDAYGHTHSGLPNRPVASELVSRSDGAIRVRWYRTHGEQFHPALVMISSAQRSWLSVGSANLTRRSLGDYDLEANIAVEMPAAAPLALEAHRWFETLWTNRAPAGIEYTADFGTFADPAQASFWAYRLLEATGLGGY